MSSRAGVKLLPRQGFYEKCSEFLRSQDVILAKIEIRNLSRITSRFGARASKQMLREFKLEIAGSSNALFAGEVASNIFAIVCPETKDPSRLLTRVHEMVDKLNYENDWPFLLEIALGIVVTKRVETAEVSTWVDRANTALIVSARTGYGVVFTSDLETQEEIRIKVAKFNSRREPPPGLTWHFQPVVNLLTGETSGYEALVRWHDPELGQISPETFIPLAEELEVIGALDAWGLMFASSKAHELLTAPALSIGVNVSSITLENHPEFVTLANREWKRIRDLGGNLVLEITESSMVENEAAMSEIMQKLKRNGLEFAIDDFGRGVTNLAVIASLPVDYLKLDKSLLRLKDDARTLGMLKIAQEIGSVLGLRVLAEGIETEKDAELVLAAGIELGQGYLYGFPKSLD